VSKYLIGITGASGVIYAWTLLKAFKNTGIETEVIVTDPAKKVWEQELGFEWTEVKRFVSKIYLEHEIDAPPASGTSNYSGMIVIPCSMATLSAIATGASRTLLQRSADVMLKEKKPLILVIRETPLSLIHIKNMEMCALAGATIFPAMPAFYLKPRSLQELVEGFVGRILNFLGVKHSLSKSWEQEYEKYQSTSYSED